MSSIEDRVAALERKAAKHQRALEEIPRLAVAAHDANAADFEAVKKVLVEHGDLIQELLSLVRGLNEDVIALKRARP